jgi:hypothetical protein
VPKGLRGGRHNGQHAEHRCPSSNREGTRFVHIQVKTSYLARGHAAWPEDRADFWSWFLLGAAGIPAANSALPSSISSFLLPTWLPTSRPSTNAGLPHHERMTPA